MEVPCVKNLAWCWVDAVGFYKNWFQFSLSSKLHFFVFLNLSLYFSLLFLLKSLNLEVRLPIHLSQCVKQVMLFPFPLSFSLLNGWNVLCIFCLFCFFLLSHVSIYFWILFDLSAHLANTLVHKMHLCIEICTHTNGYVYAHMGIHICFKKINWAFFFFLETRRHINVNARNWHVYTRRHA